MYNNYIKKGDITRETLYAIINYYNYLYNSLEVKSIPEIAEELEINPKTLRIYLEKLYTGKNIDGKYSKISLQILLCTKLNTRSPYYEDQQELKSFINRRSIVKQLKIYRKKQESKQNKG